LLRAGSRKIDKLLICVPSLKSNEESKWIKLLRIDYKDPTGKSRTWESAERLTRPKGGEIDGVGIFAVLEKETGEFLVEAERRISLSVSCS
jgi:hypothetical protein